MIYEIEKAYLDVLENSFHFDEETGEVLFDESDLEALQGEIESKVDIYACYIKNLRGDNLAIKEEVKRLNDRMKRNDKIAENLEKVIARAITETLKKDKLVTSRNSITFRSSSKLIIDDEEEFIRKNFDNDEIIKIKVERSVDKMKLKKMISDADNPVSFDGVRIEKNKNIQIK